MSKQSILTSFFNPKARSVEAPADTLHLEEDADMGIGAQATDNISNAHIVASIPLYVGGDIDGDSSDEEYNSDEEEYFDAYEVGEKLPTECYSTWKNGASSQWKPVGYLPKDSEVTVAASITEQSTVVQPLLDLIKTTGLSADAGEDIADVVSVSLGLNRPLSLSTRKNELLTKELGAHTTGPVEHLKFGMYWEMQWYDNEGNKIKYSQVHSFYKKLKKYDKEHGTNKAEKFIEVNEAGIGVPYQDIREFLKEHDHPKELISEARKVAPDRDVYFHVTDGDTKNFNGVYSTYLDHIKACDTVPIIMSTGYKVITEKDEDYPIVQAVYLDRQIRLATAEVIPTGVYFAEPNLCVLIPQGSTTLPESFKGRAGQTAESAVLIDHILATRAADGPVIFMDADPLVTSIPERMRTDKNGKDHGFSAEFVAGGRPSYSDVWKMQQISQTNLSLRDWITNLTINNGMKFIPDAEFRTQGWTGKLRGEIQDYLKHGIKAELLANAIYKKDLELIKKAYEARQKVLDNYMHQFAKAPDISELKAHLDEAQKSKFGNFFLEIVAEAGIRELLEHGILSLEVLHNLTRDALQDILYHKAIIEALGEETLTFEEVCTMYDQCTDFANISDETMTALLNNDEMMSMWRAEEIDFEDMVMLYENSDDFNEISDNTLKVLIANENVMDAVRNDEIDFDQVVHVYQDYFDGGDEDLNDFDIVTLVNAWAEYDEVFDSLYNADICVSDILSICAKGREFIDIALSKGANYLSKLDYDIDELIDLYEKEEDAFGCLFGDDPENMLEHYEVREFVALYRQFAQEVEEYKNDEYRMHSHLDDSSPYDLIVDHYKRENIDGYGSDAESEYGEEDEYADFDHRDDGGYSSDEEGYDEDGYSSDSEFGAGEYDEIQELYDADELNFLPSLGGRMVVEAYYSDMISERNSYQDKGERAGRYWNNSSKYTLFLNHFHLDNGAGLNDLGLSTEDYYGSSSDEDSGDEGAYSSDGSEFSLSYSDCEGADASMLGGEVVDFAY